MPDIPVTSLVFAFVAAVVLQLVFRRVAFHIGLVDKPDERKRHSGEVPLVGGIAIFCAFVFGALALDLPLSDFRPLFFASLIIIIVGLLDDLRELSASFRFLAQIAAAFIIAQYGGATLNDLGGLLPGVDTLELGWFALPFTIFAVVGIINAINMIDGMDGLAGSVVLVAVSGMAVSAWVAGDQVAFSLLLILASAVVAFLLFNLTTGKNNRPLLFMVMPGACFWGCYWHGSPSNCLRGNSQPWRRYRQSGC